MQSTLALSRGRSLPDHEAIRLMMAATGRTRTDVVLGFEITSEEVERFDTFVERRSSDEPLQYIEGSVPFGPVDLFVDDRVLVPRPETEYMFERIVATVESPAVIVDLCCGSGNLALALAATFATARTYATDLSTLACDVAAANAEANDLMIEVLVGDLFEALPSSLEGHVDLIVANPPYIGSAEMSDLPPDVRREPTMALLGGERGDEIVARIAGEAVRWLSPGGLIFCEISEFNTDRTLDHFRHLRGEIHHDLTGRPRFVQGRRS
ncbi:MAG: peptide chain release factor N(5)-glutamine methyltransferase [Actinomycetia bacterium]|nr:peptide chain release factor N(5)-glutamine methyltransferase [Actinomycetes bacterium]